MRVYGINSNRRKAHDDCEPDKTTINLQLIGVIMRIVLVRAVILAVTLSVFLLAGCTTKVTGTWKKSDYAGQPMKSILVVGLTGDPTNRLFWEDVMTANLKKGGIEKAVSSLSTFPSDREVDKEQIINYVKEKGFDGVLVTRLVNTREEQVYHPPAVDYYSYGGRYGYYSNFGSYYTHAYAQLNRQGYYTTQTVFLLETNLYQVETLDIIWSMTSDTFDQGSKHQLIKSLSKKVLQTLKKDQLI